MGKKDADEPQSSQALARISEDLYNRTGAVRNPLIDQSADFVAGGFDPTQTPSFGAMKLATETQFDNARQRVLRSTPEGGGLAAALSNIELGRAGALAGGTADIYNQERGQALSLATGAPLQQSTAGMGQAGAIQAQIAQANAARDSAAKTGAGQGIGTYMGMKALGSSREWKENKRPTKTLDALMSIPVEKWKYIGMDGDHVGPYAEDFNEAFGLDGGKYIMVIDALGVLMRAVQELTEEVRELKGGR